MTDFDVAELERLYGKLLTCEKCGRIVDTLILGLCRECDSEAVTVEDWE